MPELPEVEVTKRGIAPVLNGAIIKGFVIRTPKLRTIISPEFNNLHDLKVLSIARRGKYIILFVTQGSILIHLGMTGHLQIIAAHADMTPKKHDHVDIILNDGSIIRFNDQRRFGLFEWYPSSENPYNCRWLKDLGPEPLEDGFNGQVLHAALSTKKAPLKEVIMNSHVLVGVGNIYASEVLFRSRLNPFMPAASLSLESCELLTTNIKIILTESIANGGTTIRDFSGADGRMGYFVRNLQVYGHEDECCPVCGTKIKQRPICGRSTFFCSHCQAVEQEA